jgi:hypothetical protein
MGLQHSPSIVTTGLILALDAVNPKSYSYSENLLRYSQQMDIGGLAVSSWDKTRCNYTGNVAIAPDGTLTAGKLYDDSTATATHYLNGPGFGSYANSTILPTGSIYVKAAEKNLCGFYIIRDNGSAYATSQMLLANLTSGTIQSGPGTITPASNGWYRISGTATTSGTNYAIRLTLLDPSGNVSYTGDGASGIYIWGGQLERNSAASNYTPTANISIQASNTWIDLSTTRNNGTTANTPTYEIANGAFYFSGYGQANSYVNFASVASNLPTMSVEVWANLINNGPNGFAYILGQSNAVWRLMYSTSSFGWVCATTNNSWYSSNTTVSTSGTSTNNRWNHVVAVYDGTNHKIYVNGVLSATSTGIASGNIVSPGTANGLNIMLSDAGNVDNGAGRLAIAKIYSIALTPEQILQNFNAHRARYGL